MSKGGEKREGRFPPPAKNRKAVPSAASKHHPALLSAENDAGELLMETLTMPWSSKRAERRVGKVREGEKKREGKKGK